MSAEIEAELNEDRDLFQEKYESERKTRNAISKYIRCMERFEQASKEFGESCNAVREVVPKQSRFVVRVDYQDYLVTTDCDGSFNVEPVQVL